MISVCMPFWNRQRFLDESLAEHRRLYPDIDIEISICDDGSIPPAVVPEGVVLTRLPEKRYALNPCVPINQAVNASTHDIIVLTCPEIVHAPSSTLLNETLTRAVYCWVITLDVPLPVCVTLSLHRRVIEPSGPPPPAIPDPPPGRPP